MAVNCLDTDAMSNTVSVVILAPDARSAMPRTPDQITFPSTPTAAEQPGSSALMAPSSTS
ncbi:Uncharacterised protein [Mycobacterium tuberculosis]|uniref:Uncharacterized protein n=1 Tax=Mycobacterium tuberculosis TaxID=1773 RepID=A0A655DE06_MYCTX|nr:Uncharacterised protein [Mycobacterium tuberculosis]COY77427.1 Uncharacterised protein [Mycobacterium tuberculosis]